ncbi:MAG: helix-turn-helix transcriptional regulator [Gemmobacter sp.]|nr:helix-turn-helix transcriptional regulator [Gemmobacter sp.]
MREGSDLQAFSRFIGALHEARLALCGPDLLAWGARTLSDIVGFDAAWCGWADMMPDEVDIIGTTMMNLPADYVAFWREIKSDDLLASDVKAMKATQRLWAHYDRAGDRQTDGMQALADRYGLRQLSVVTRPVDPLRPQLFLSAYRGGPRARPLQDNELTFLACALDHLQAALDRGDDGADGVPRLLVDRQARPVAGSAAALALWSGWRGDAAPACFDTWLGRRGLRTVAVPSPLADGHMLTELRLAPHRLSDDLTLREREVAVLISQGRTHKEIARLLGLSPATVRNHTARIYAKTQVGSRAALTRALMEPTRAPRLLA